MKESIFEFIVYELMQNKTNAVMTLSNKLIINKKPIEKRIVKLVKAIELLTHFDNINNKYFIQ
jgi:hypothetical protein